MGRIDAYIDQIEHDPRIPEANRLAIVASLRAVVAAQEASDSIELTVDVCALLAKASRYMLLAEKLHSIEPKALLAILLAVCDLQKTPTKA